MLGAPQVGQAYARIRKRFLFTMPNCSSQADEQAWAAAHADIPPSGCVQLLMESAEVESPSV